MSNENRTSLLKKNIAWSFLVRGWSGVVMLLMVPLTLKCLGQYTNGLWLTISSILVWIDQMDIGLGNGLRNTLAKHIAHNDIEKAQATISSTLGMLTAIIIPVTIALVALISLCDVYGFLNVEETTIPNLREVLTISVILFCSTFVFKFIGNFYMGMQLNAVSTLLITIGQTTALAGTFVLYITGTGTLLAIAIVNTAAPLLTYLAAYPITFSLKYPQLRPRLSMISFTEAKSLMNTGIQFFMLQIACVILFMSTNIIISRLFSPEMVTPYQITFRYFQIMQLACTILFTPFWTATTDAWERHDKTWLKASSKKLDLMLLAIIATTILMFFFAPVFYQYWIGNDIDIPWQMSLMMAFYTIVTITSNRYSFILNGIGKLKMQLWFTLCAAILYIPLCILVTKFTDSIIALMAVMWVIQVPGMIANAWLVGKVTK